MYKTALMAGALALLTSLTHEANAQRPRPHTAHSAPKREVIASMSPDQAISRLMAAGDTANASRIRRALSGRLPRKPRTVSELGTLSGQKKAWEHTGHVFGYYDDKGVAGSDAPVPIRDAGNIAADPSLKNSNIKIVLNRLRVYEYPGTGLHNILFDAKAQHQAAADQQQPVEFTQKYRAQQGEGAGVTGYPIFVGLKPGSDGISLDIYTINVNNQDDQNILSFLGGQVFNNGLKLLNAVNPAIPVITGFATGITEAFAHRHDNQPVQSFFMGLDFSGLASTPQLREGSYVMIQTDDVAAWDWSQWIFNPKNGQVVKKAAPTVGVPLNYMVLSISKMQP